MEDKKPNNPQAFAMGYGTDNYNVDQPGMTLRDYFANSAMIENMRRSYSGNDNHIANSQYEIIAKYSYAIADEMLKQREL